MAKKKLSPIPSPRQMSPISAFLCVADVKKATDFYSKAFGFTLVGDMMKAGKVAVHAAMRYRNTNIMLGAPGPDGSHASPAMAKLEAFAFGLYVYVEDVDALYKKVKRYKGITVGKPMDMFWGDRTLEITDRDGHRWTFASRFAKPTMDEMQKAMMEMMKQG